MECAESCKDIECKGENERCRGNPNKGGDGICVCDSGFKQDTNGTCVDIDECEELQVPPCSQVNLFIAICSGLNVLQFKGNFRKKPICSTYTYYILTATLSFKINSP